MSPRFNRTRHKHQTGDSIRFTIFHICFVTGLVALVCCVAIGYRSFLTTQRERQEQNLIIDVFVDQTTAYRARTDCGLIFLAFGVHDDGSWIPVPQDFVDKITTPKLMSATAVNRDQLDRSGRFGVVHSIENLAWVDEETIRLDYRTYAGFMRGDSRDNMLFRLSNGTWEVVSEGEYWFQ